MRCPACPGILLEDDDDTQRATHYVCGPAFTSYTCDSCCASVKYAEDELTVLRRMQEATQRGDAIEFSTPLNPFIDPWKSRTQ